MGQDVAPAVVKSWRTTAAGVLGGLCLILPQILAAIDSDPLTVPHLEAVLTGLAMLGLGAAARDNGVTSEAAGAKP